MILNECHLCIIVSGNCRLSINSGTSSFTFEIVLTVYKHHNSYEVVDAPMLILVHIYV